jgi:N-acetyl-anhydromuramyl-L-alanine amidase AmpD
MRVSGIPYVQGRNAYTDSDGRKYAIAIHNTANDASARDEASYATRRTDGVSSHFYADDVEVIQSLDTNHRAGHAGSAEGNNHAVAVEITGTNAKSRSWWLANVAWDQLGRVLAVVCRQYGIAVRRAPVAEMASNPQARAIYGHDDMRRAWGGTTHTDPGPNFPWDRLFDAINQHLIEEDDVTADELKAAVIAGVHGALDQAATRSTPTGRQMGDDIAVLLRTQIEPLTKELAALRQQVTQAAAAEAIRDTELRALVEQHAAGSLDAEDVVRRMGELLSGDTQG